MKRHSPEGLWTLEQNGGQPDAAGGERREGEEGGRYQGADATLAG